MIGVLVAFLAAAAAGVWFLGTKTPAEQSSPEDNLMTAVEIQTPYGDLLLEGDWVSCLRYEVTRGEVTELNVAAEIAGAHVKLFDLYLGSEENLAGYLTAKSGEKVPVGVVVHDIVPGQDWSEEDRELAFTIQDALNAVLAQLGAPDMRVPIQYALTYPDRLPCPVKQLRLEDWNKLTFYAPDDEAFPAMNLARRALTMGGLYPAALNAANEVAVAAFIAGEIGFSDITRLAAAALELMLPTPVSVDDVFAADELVRAKTRTAIDAMK